MISHPALKRNQGSSVELIFQCQYTLVFPCSLCVSGEVKGRKILGLHNWIQFHLLESYQNLNYYGHIAEVFLPASQKVRSRYEFKIYISLSEIYRVRRTVILSHTNVLQTRKTGKRIFHVVISAKKVMSLLRQFVCLFAK